MKNQKAFSLIEVLIAITFVAVLSAVIVQAGYFANNLKIRNEERTQAVFLATEAMESTKTISWDNLQSGSYFSTTTGSGWSLVPGSEVVDSHYTRSIEIQDVYRASSTNDEIHGPIVTSGGYLDPDTKYISVSIQWQSKGGDTPLSYSLGTYVHLWEAERWTQADWVGGSGQASWSVDTKFFTSSAGVRFNTEGIVTLNSAFINWNNASTTAELNLGNDRDANDIFFAEPYAYVVTDDNTSGSNPELFIIDVSDPYAPYIIGELNLQISNNALGVDVENGYAYISTSDDTKELIIADVSNPAAPQFVTSYNLSSSNNGLDVQVNGDDVYIIQTATLYKFNVANPASPQLIFSYNNLSDARQIAVSGDYVFIATGDSNREVHVVHKDTLNWAGEFNISGSLNATDIAIRGNYAYVTTEAYSSGPEFYVLDISDPANITQVGSYELGAQGYAVSVVGAYAVISINSSSQEIRILDVSFPATISVAGTANLTNYVNALATDCKGIYAVTEDNAKGLQIVGNGEVDCAFVDNGTLESSTFDTESTNTAYNWLRWDSLEPAGTSIKFQIATSDAESGPFTYLGPDGTSVTYYTNGSHEYINTIHTAERYIRYKVLLDTQSELQAPQLEEITIGYSQRE